MFPFAAFSSVTLAPGTSAPLGSFTAPRSEVDADWLKPVGVEERMHKSANPGRNRLTAVPPGKTACVPDLVAFTFSYGLRLC